MGVRVVGVSLVPEVLAALDELAVGAGVSRSAMVGVLVGGEVERRRRVRGGGPVVVVDGVRFVPERRRRGGGGG